MTCRRKPAPQAKDAAPATKTWAVNLIASSEHSLSVLQEALKQFIHHQDGILLQWTSGTHHGQQAWPSVLCNKVLICKLGAINADAASAITLQGNKTRSVST